MIKIECSGICEGCPVALRAGGTTVLFAEIGYLVPAEITWDGQAAGMEFYKGEPVNRGQRLSDVAIAKPNEEIIAKFQAPGRMLDDGSLVKKFEDCNGPAEERYGFMLLKKRVVCAALRNFL